MSAFDHAVTTLSTNGDLRVWSMIVTIFGDLARNPDDEISGALLSALTERIGIRPEAVRVALHRLRKDGWIITRKRGRSGYYRLSPTAHTASLKAGDRIYATDGIHADHWHVLIFAPMSQTERQAQEQPLLAAGYAQITPGVFLKFGTAPAPDGAFSVEGQIGKIPAWLKSANTPETLVDGYVSLETALLALGAPTPDTELETATLRVLIIHNWRRLLLRHPPLPDQFYGPQWRAAACRILVAKLLATLPRPDLATLENAVG